MARPFSLCSMLFALGCIAVLAAAGGSAAPREWDIGAYDRCLGSWQGDKTTDLEGFWDHLDYCCIKSGGVLGGGGPGQGSCVAPPAEEAERPTGQPPTPAPEVDTAPVGPRLTQVWTPTVVRPPVQQAPTLQRSP